MQQLKDTALVIPAHLLQPIKDALIELGYVTESTSLHFVQDAYFKYVMVRQTSVMTNTNVPYAFGFLPKEIQEQLDGYEPPVDPEEPTEPTYQLALKLNDLNINGSAVNFNLSVDGFDPANSPTNLHASLYNTGTGETITTTPIASPNAGTTYPESIQNIDNGNYTIKAVCTTSLGRIVGQNQSVVIDVGTTEPTEHKVDITAIMVTGSTVNFKALLSNYDETEVPSIIYGRLYNSDNTIEVISNVVQYPSTSTEIDFSISDLPNGEFLVEIICESTSGATKSMPSPFSINAVFQPSLPSPAGMNLSIEGDCIYVIMAIGEYLNELNRPSALRVLVTDSATGSEYASFEVLDPVLGTIYDVSSIKNIPVGEYTCSIISTNVAGSTVGDVVPFSVLEAPTPANVFSGLTVDATGFHLQSIPIGGIEWATSTGETGSAEFNNGMGISVVFDNLLADGDSITITSVNGLYSHQYIYVAPVVDVPVAPTLRAVTVSGTSILANAMVSGISETNAPETLWVSATKDGVETDSDIIYAPMDSAEYPTAISGLGYGTYTVVAKTQNSAGTSISAEREIIIEAPIQYVSPVQATVTIQSINATSVTLDLTVPEYTETNAPKSAFIRFFQDDLGYEVDLSLVENPVAGQVYSVTVNDLDLANYTYKAVATTSNPFSDTRAPLVYVFIT